jgi:hypothetical protein
MRKLNANENWCDPRDWRLFKQFGVFPSAEFLLISKSVRAKWSNCINDYSVQSLFSGLPESFVFHRKTRLFDAVRSRSYWKAHSALMWLEHLLRSSANQ